MSGPSQSEHPDATLTTGFERIRPGEIVAITPRQGWGKVSGQVLVADAASITLSHVGGGFAQPGTVETIPVERIESVHRTGMAPLPGTIVRTYVGKQQADTANAFRADADALARGGYTPTSQSWAPGQWGCGAFLFALLLCIVLIGFLVFMYLLVVKPDGTLTVTFTREAAAPAVAAEPAGETKVCPRCAETVKVAAVVCRFCGHEFEPAAEELAPVDPGSDNEP